MIAEIQDAGGPVITAVFVTKFEPIVCPNCSVTLVWPPKAVYLVAPTGILPLYVCPKCQANAPVSAWKRPKSPTP